MIPLTDLLFQLCRFQGGPHRTLCSSLKSREKRIKFNSCREWYTSKVKSNLFKNCTPSGIQVEVNFIDTLEERRHDSKAPTVLALHGAPGSYRDFADIIEQLTSQGCRVIAPNLPDIKLTHQSRVYYLSTEEKYEILTDFLRHINAPPIDVAVMHSAGVYSGMKLWYERPEYIRSLFLLNPSGHRRCKAMKPSIYIDLLARINMSHIGRLLWQRFGVLVIMMLGHATKISREESDSSLTALLGMYMAGVERLGIYFNHLNKCKTPTVMVFSDRDKLIDLDIYMELLAMLGASDDHVNTIPVKGDTVEKGL